MTMGAGKESDSRKKHPSPISRKGSGGDFQHSGQLEVGGGNKGAYIEQINVPSEAALPRGSVN